MPISLPTSYDYEDTLGMGDLGLSNPSSPETPIDFYIEMQERHYDDLLEYELEQEELRRQRREEERREERAMRRHSRLRRQHQNNQVVNEQHADSPIIMCHCGYAAAEDVISIGFNIGRRYFRCRVYPTGCTFWQWIDQQFPSRAAEYANEIQHQLTTLQNHVIGFRTDVSRLNDQLQGLNIRRQN